MCSLLLALKFRSSSVPAGVDLTLHSSNGLVIRVICVSWFKPCYWVESFVEIRPNILAVLYLTIGRMLIQEEQGEIV